MSDLLTHPLWTADTLGSPLPDNDFGVSVSLPLWQHVVGYEEGDAEVIAKFRSGYPRFCCPPAISALFAEAEKRHAGAEERALVFPRLAHAERCVAFVRKEFGPDAGRALEFSAEHPLGVAIFPAAAYKRARLFWRYCGEVVSTRQSCHVLGLAPATATQAEGASASQALRERLAHHAGQAAEDVFLFPSGMAATFAVHRMLTTLRPGTRTVQLDFPYVDVLKLQQEFGAGVAFYPNFAMGEHEGFTAMLKSEPLAGIFSEVPTNPLLRCVDYQRLQAMLAQANCDVPLVIDDTVGTSVNVDAWRVADVVTTSLTKAFSGAGDVMAGSVILNRSSRHYSAFAAFLREHADHELWCDDAVALERNSRDYAERVQMMSRNSCGLFAYLSRHPKVERVWHSMNEGGAGYALLQREGGGHSCLFSFTLKDRSLTPAFYDALAVCKGPSLGTDFTLVCPYTMLAHYDELPWAESCGVDRNLIRVSAGIEPLGDLVARFERALRE